MCHSARCDVFLGFNVFPSQERLTALQLQFTKIGPVVDCEKKSPLSNFLDSNFKLSNFDTNS